MVKIEIPENVIFVLAHNGPNGVRGQHVPLLVEKGNSPENVVARTSILQMRFPRYVI